MSKRPHEDEVIRRKAAQAARMTSEEKFQVLIELTKEFEEVLRRSPNAEKQRAAMREIEEEGHRRWRAYVRWRRKHPHARA